MVNVNNEWDRLREVFVGTAEYANNPMKGKDLHSINYAHKNNIDDNTNVNERKSVKYIIEYGHDSVFCTYQIVLCSQ